jgi:RNA polymerase sigma-70 factor (ECF subfamily)
LALTLREVCGLTTEAIARAFLTSPSTLAQRIVRAKNKIRDAGIPYEIPGRSELPARLDAVLQVIYLVFNEGYSATSGSEYIRQELAQEAIRLGRLVVELLPEAEAQGLLALMLIQDSRRLARLDAQAPSFADTDWQEIAGFYDLLLQINPSPIVELNRAVALAMRDGPATGLQLIDDLLARNQLIDYHLTHAARAEFLQQLGDREAAKAALEQALLLAPQAAEQRFLQRRLAALEK